MIHIRISHGNGIFERAVGEGIGYIRTGVNVMWSKCDFVKIACFEVRFIQI
jgi:hypothetical protein